MEGKGTAAPCAIGRKDELAQSLPFDLPRKRHLQPFGSADVSSNGRGREWLVFDRSNRLLLQKDNEANCWEFKEEKNRTGAWKKKVETVGRGKKTD